MFTRAYFMEKELLNEINAKGIKLRDYFMKYLSLRSVFIYIYRNKRQIFNLQKIENKLKKKKIEEVIYKVDDMMDLLNMKYKERFVNDLDLVDNLVKICMKLTEKNFIFTNKMLYSTEWKEENPEKSGAKPEIKKSGDHGFELI